MGGICGQAAGTAALPGLVCAVGQPRGMVGLSGGDHRIWPGFGKDAGRHHRAPFWQVALPCQAGRLRKIPPGMPTFG